MSLVEWVAKGEIEEVRKCIQNGSDVNGKDIHGDTMLMRAILGGYLCGLKLLRQNGPSMDKGYIRKMMMIGCHVYAEIVKLLLENGADVEAEGGQRGENALMLAATYGCTEMVKLLLEYGANIKAVSFYGVTALIFSARGGHTETAKLLLENGADMEVKNINGVTALMSALNMGQTETVKILKDEIERRKQLKMARYTFLRHTNFHLAQEIAVRINPKR